MMNLKTTLSALILTLLIAASAWAASVTVTLPNGSVWRGQTDDRVVVEYRQGAMQQKLTGVLVKAGDMYIVVREDGGSNEVPIFRTDLVSLASAGEAEASDADEGAASPGGKAAEPNADETGDKDDAAGNEAGGVFYLPLSGMVGLEFRPEEIESIVAQADAAGPGQTIVLDIESGGGSVVEYIIIAQTIMDAKKKHSLVAWVGEAISAAAGTALACDRMVFKDNARLGAITMLRGGGIAVSDYEEEKWITMLKNVLRSSNYSEYWARPMVRNDSYISYIKDPVTGECEYFDSPQYEPGEVVLSNYGENCVLGVELAVECCLAYGRADSKEELAAVLDMDEWVDLGSGQKMHDDWHDLCARCERDYQKSGARLNMLGEYDQLVRIRKEIDIYKGWLRWWKRAPNKMMMMGAPDPEQLDRMIDALERQLRELTRGGG